LSEGFSAQPSPAHSRLETEAWQIPSPIPGKNVFIAIVHNAAGNVTDNRTFSLVAY
jgi:hypothetical protein